MKSIRALAFKTTESILTPPVPTQVVIDPALVDILAVVARAELEARVTPAGVPARLVQAAPVPANPRVAAALVDVDAGVAVGCEHEALLTQALEAAGVVLTVAVLADSRHFQTLIAVPAIPP